MNTRVQKHFRSSLCNVHEYTYSTQFIVCPRVSQRNMLSVVMNRSQIITRRGNKMLLGGYSDVANITYVRVSQ